VFTFSPGNELGLLSDFRKLIHFDPWSKFFEFNPGDEYVFTISPGNESGLLSDLRKLITFDPSSKFSNSILGASVSFYIQS